ERNIGDVCLGDTRFATWYPSWYPKEILGEKTLQLAEDGKSMGIVVPVLYICPMCFAYSKDGEEWKQHRKGCEKKNHIPGQEIYVKNRGKGKAEPYREGQWAIWEVDGAVDKTFCQKLSLFAKLFLDNKSVFFDVTTFKYFLYVHTFISKANLPSGRKVGDKQIIGFFSKEKMSWDNNNLACILIFPPWQRKGLGANLMGISYSIARREQIMGGPEKPISEMGRKGYRRYWGTEISRYLINQYEEYCKQPKKFKLAMHISDISKATWIAPDDVLNTMREMKVVEKYDPPKTKGKGKDEGSGNGKGKVEPQAGAIDIDAIYTWVKDNKIKLESVVDEDGFLPGYAEK
ncbi:acyl-CoA N-acyltransferase, partial [Acephala macrosclerotiorum]